MTQIDKIKRDLSTSHLEFIDFGCLYTLRIPDFPDAFNCETKWLSRGAIKSSLR